MSQGRMGEARGPSAGRESAVAIEDTAEELPLGEVDVRYPMEWVALAVTRVDEQQAISHGRVLYHSPARQKLTPVILRTWARQPQTRICVLFAGPRPTTTEEWGERLKQAADGPQLNAWW
jgi:hypothetical protein